MSFSFVNPMYIKSSIMSFGMRILDFSYMSNISLTSFGIEVVLSSDRFFICSFFCIISTSSVLLYASFSFDFFVLCVINGTHRRDIIVIPSMNDNHTRPFYVYIVVCFACLQFVYFAVAVFAVLVGFAGVGVGSGVGSGVFSSSSSSSSSGVSSVTFSASLTKSSTFMR